jgi:hypothetical protein
MINKVKADPLRKPLRRVGGEVPTGADKL